MFRKFALGMGARYMIYTTHFALQEPKAIGEMHVVFVQFLLDRGFFY